MSRLTVVRRGGGGRGGAVPALPDVAMLDVDETIAPVALAALLRATESPFVMIDAGSPARIAAGLALAQRFPEAGIAIDEAPMARRDRRMIRSEGLRFLDPTPVCAVVFSRDLALACLSLPAVAAAGDRWPWALARAAATQGTLAVEQVTKAPLLRRRMRAVDPETLEAVAAAETGHVPRRRILVIGRIEASVSLYFDGLPAHIRACLRFIEAEALMDCPNALAGADAAIVVRDLERCHDTGLLTRLSALGIPSLFFADDNPLALAAEDRHWRFYTPERLRGLLARFDGVIASTAPLAAVFARFHPDTKLFGPVLDESAITACAGGESLRIAITGGSFRKSAAQRDIVPAIVELARHSPGVVLMAPRDFGAAPADGITVQPMPRTPSFPQFLKTWRQGRPTVLLHPRSVTGNEAFKTPNALLVALYLGAIPIVDRDEPAYRDFDESDGVLTATDAAGWARAMERSRDPKLRQALWEALARCCAARFAPDAQAEILARLAETNAPLTPQVLAARRATLARLRLVDPGPLRLLRRGLRRVASRG